MKSKQHLLKKIPIFIFVVLIFTQLFLPVFAIEESKEDFVLASGKYLQPSGTASVLVIPVYFPDYTPPEENTFLINYRFFGAASSDVPSVKSYFHEESFGKLDITGTITEWICADMPISSYYTESGVKNLYTEMIGKAIINGYKMSDFDADNDGCLDAVYLVLLEEEHTTEKIPFPYQLDYQSVNINCGATLSYSDLQISNVKATSAITATLKLLGVPLDDNKKEIVIENDGSEYFYNTYSNETHSEGVIPARGEISSSDPFGNKEPKKVKIPYINGFFKYMKGWASAKIITEECTVSLEEISSSNQIALIMPENWNGSLYSEYFAVELVNMSDNSALTTYENSMLRIWHIDASLRSNSLKTLTDFSALSSASTHSLVEMVSSFEINASDFSKEKNKNFLKSKYFSTADSFTTTTQPSTVLYNNVPSLINITDIDLTKTNATFKLSYFDKKTGPLITSSSFENYGTTTDKTTFQIYFDSPFDIKNSGRIFVTEKNSDKVIDTQFSVIENAPTPTLEIVFPKGFSKSATYTISFLEGALVDKLGKLSSEQFFDFNINNDTDFIHHEQFSFSKDTISSDFILMNNGNFAVIQHSENEGDSTFNILDSSFKVFKSVTVEDVVSSKLSSLSDGGILMVSLNSQDNLSVIKFSSEGLVEFKETHQSSYVTDISSVRVWETMTDYRIINYAYTSTSVGNLSYYIYSKKGEFLKQENMIKNISNLQSKYCINSDGSLLILNNIQEPFLSITEEDEVVALQLPNNVLNAIKESSSILSFTRSNDNYLITLLERKVYSHYTVTFIRLNSDFEFVSKANLNINQENVARKIANKTAVALDDNNNIYFSIANDNQQSTLMHINQYNRVVKWETYVDTTISNFKISPVDSALLSNEIGNKSGIYSFSEQYNIKEEIVLEGDINALLSNEYEAKNIKREINILRKRFDVLSEEDKKAIPSITLLEEAEKRLNDTYLLVSAEEPYDSNIFFILALVFALLGIFGLIFVTMRLKLKSSKEK